MWPPHLWLCLWTVLFLEWSAVVTAHQAGTELLLENNQSSHNIRVLVAMNEWLYTLSNNNMTQLTSVTMAEIRVEIQNCYISATKSKILIFLVWMVVLWRANLWPVWWPRHYSVVWLFCITSHQPSSQHSHRAQQTMPTVSQQYTEKNTVPQPTHRLLLVQLLFSLDIYDTTWDCQPDFYPLFFRSWELWAAALLSCLSYHSL